MNGADSRGTVMVVGGGITGISAAIEASEAGCDVVLIERAAYLGGRVAQMHQYFPKLCPPVCGLEINLRQIRTSTHIRAFTLSEVVEVHPQDGRHRVTVEQQPRFVNERCTACGACTAVCPESRPDAFNYGMGSTCAIYFPSDLAWPPLYTIDPATCKKEQCGKCAAACPYGAIDLQMNTRRVEFEVQAIIWATGWNPFDASVVEGLGVHGNMISNLQMERLAAPTGPTKGRIVRPSDGKEIESVAFVQCAGSRDENHLKHCSSVCCMASLKQARYVRAQYPDAHIYMYYIDLRSPGKHELFLAESQKDEKLHLIKGKVAKVIEDEASGDLVVEAEDVLAERRIRQKVSLVVLATGMVPALEKDPSLPASGLSRDPHGFLSGAQPLAGHFVAGCARRPMDVASCVRDASSAALKALQSCVSSHRG
ncbi:MAG: CoB--CoM heterodisulfide reductase iron-sulfur subunit A family protein [Terriglobales bacterium]|jgi:quinone-modifying oxidoreductase subunit QmoA